MQKIVLQIVNCQIVMAKKVATKTVSDSARALRSQFTLYIIYIYSYFISFKNILNDNLTITNAKRKKTVTFQRHAPLSSCFKPPDNK